jgi:hypothetical protein
MAVSSGRSGDMDELGAKGYQRMLSRAPFTTVNGASGSIPSMAAYG